MTASPAFILIAAALLLALSRKEDKGLLAIVIAAPLLTLWEVWQGTAGAGFYMGGFKLLPYMVHDYSKIFATVFCIAALAGGIFAYKSARISELAAAYFYAGSAVGVCFSGDWVSLFIFWEMMALGSTVVILCGASAKARAAALRYATLHFVGGAVLLAGIAGQIVTSGNIYVLPIQVDLVDLPYLDVLGLKIVSQWLIILGLLINAGAPPFSSWIPDSYPESSPTGAVFLSAFTTKSAVFVLLTVFAGSDILIALGLFMVVYGIIYAMLENDMRRILSYSIINQVGFMLTGIGIGTTEALDGAAAHAFCHIIYKGLLLMAAGAVLYRTGKSKCTDLGGLYHTMKYTTACAIIGALSISAFPLTSGFISKSIISSAAVHEQLPVVTFILLAASAGVFLHAGVKFPWFVFFQKDSGMRPKEAPFNMKAGMFILSVGCLLPGFYPELVYNLLPRQPEYVFYKADKVVTQLQLLMFSGLAFFMMLPMMRRTETISLDFDWFYRVPIKNVLLQCEALLFGLYDVLLKSLRFVTVRISEMMVQYYGPRSVMAGTWGVGVTTLIIAVLLSIFLFLYYTAK
jgi:multicomponent Na+:H+ antiporter subunit D